MYRCSASPVSSRPEKDQGERIVVRFSCSLTDLETSSRWRRQLCRRFKDNGGPGRLASSTASTIWVSACADISADRACCARTPMTWERMDARSPSAFRVRITRPCYESRSARRTTLRVTSVTITARRSAARRAPCAKKRARSST